MFDDKNILIIGQNALVDVLKEILKEYHPDTYNYSNPELSTKSDVHYDLAIVCLNEDFDQSEIEQIIKDHYAELYLIQYSSLYYDTYKQQIEALLNDNTKERIIIAENLKGLKNKNLKKYSLKGFEYDIIELKNIFQIWNK